MSARNLTTELRRTFEVGDSFFNQKLGRRACQHGGAGTAWGLPTTPCPARPATRLTDAASRLTMRMTPSAAYSCA